MPRLSAVLLLVMTALLWGCGKDKSADGLDVGIPLRIYVDPVGKDGETLLALLRDFRRTTGIVVQPVGTTSGSSDMLGEVTQILASRSNQVDVVMLDVVWPPILHEYLEDLTPKLGQDREQFMPQLLDANTVQGRLVGIPFYLDVGLMYYRTDLLDRYGFDAPPETWAELESMAKVIQAGERERGNAEFWGMAMDANAEESLTCIALEWQSSEGGGTILDNDGNVTINNPRAAVAFDRARGWLGTICNPESVNSTTEAARLQFFNGNAAFMRSWTFAWETLKAPDSKVKGHVGVARIPAGAERHSVILGGWQLGVSASSQNKENAWRLVKFLTSAGCQKQRALGEGFPPTRPALYTDPDILDRHPHMPMMAEAVNGAIERPSRASRDRYGEISAIYYEGVNAYLRGSEDTTIFLQRMEGRFRDAMRR